jgi:hypothetical protein
MTGTCPCGSNKTTAFFGGGQGDLLPFLFSQDTVVIFEGVLDAHTPVSRIDWPGEPPDPPPRLFHIA